MKLLDRMDDIMEQVHDMQYGDTSNLHYDSWRKQRRFIRSIIKRLVGLGVVLMILAWIFQQSA